MSTSIHNASSQRRRIGSPLVKAAIRLAADASLKRTIADRTLVKRSLIDTLRRELDALGFGEDWRGLHQLIREEERKP